MTLLREHAGRPRRGRAAHGAGAIHGGPRGTRMRAVVLPRPGSADELELQELEIPIPADREVLVRVRAATVTRGDVALRRIPRLMWPLLRKAQDEMPHLSTNSTHRVLDAATHSSLISGPDAQASSGAILDVVAVIRSGTAVP